MGLLRWDSTGFRRHRRRQRVFIAATVTAAAAMLAAAWSTADNLLQNLLVELGGGLLLLVGASVLFNRALDRYQSSEVESRRELDRDAVIREFAEARVHIDMLGTWTSLLSNGYDTPAFDALKLALKRGALVRVLLLDPYGQPARTRSVELGHKPDVPAAIVDNLRKLHEFREALPVDRGDRFQVRLYSTMPAVQAYRWDDKVIMSFLSPNKPTYETGQLETFVSTPLADFVTEQFETIWNGGATATLATYMSVTGTLAGQRYGDRHRCALEYFWVDGVAYVSDHGFSEWLDEQPLSSVVLRLEDPFHPDNPAPSRRYHLERVPKNGNGAVNASSVHAMYKSKYGEESRPLFRLVDNVLK